MHGIELDIETHRIMVARTRNQIQDLNARLVAIEDLEEARSKALERTVKVHAKREEDFNSKLPEDHGIMEGGLVLLYDNRHKQFPGKLHTRWMGPYRITIVYPNGHFNWKIFKGFG